MAPLNRAGFRSRRPAARGVTRPEDRLTAANAAVPGLPRPVTPVIGVHNLQRAQPAPIQLDGHHQVRGRHGHLDDLDQRTVAQRDLLPGLGAAA